MVKSARLVSAIALAAWVAGCQSPEDRREKHLAQAAGYLEEKQLVEASIELRNALQIDGQDGPTRLRLAGIHEELGDRVNAAREYIRAADVLVDDVATQVKAGEYLLRMGRFADARLRAEAALGRQRTDVRALVLRANALAGLKDFDAALADFEQAIALQPRDALPYTDFANFQTARGDSAGAEASFRQAIAVAPESVDARLALANYHWSQGRADETERTLKAALGIDASHEAANRAMAALYIATRRASEAEPHLKVLERSPAVAPRLARADYLMTARRTEEAAALLRRMVAEPQAFTEASLRLAALERGQGDPAKAHARVDGVLAREPQNAKALLQKGQLLLAERKYEEASDRLEAAAAADPQLLSVHAAIADLREQEHNVPGAIAAWNTLVQLNPAAIVGHLQVARLELSRRQYDAALQRVRAALLRQPDNPIGRSLLIEALMATDQLREAEAELTAMRARYPTSAVVETQWGTLRTRLRDVRGARAAYDRALALDPQSLDALRGLAALDTASGDTAAARDRVEKIRALRPADPNVLLLAARTAVGRRDWPAAEQALRGVLEIDASRLEAYQMLGQVFLLQRKLDAARVEFERAAARQPDSIAALTMTAMMYEAQQKWPEAEAWYERVLAVDPRAGVAANNLAMLAADRGGDLDVALNRAQIAKASLPDSLDVEDTLGWVFYKKRLHLLAVESFRRCVDTDPQNWLYRYHLGLAASALGDTATARSSLEAALRLRPDFPGSDEARRILAGAAAKSRG